MSVRDHKTAYFNTFLSYFKLAKLEKADDKSEPE